MHHYESRNSNLQEEINSFGEIFKDSMNLTIVDQKTCIIRCCKDVNFLWKKDERWRRLTEEADTVKIFKLLYNTISDKKFIVVDG